MSNKSLLNKLTEWQSNGNNAWIKRIKNELLGTLQIPMFNWISISKDESLFDEDDIKLCDDKTNLLVIFGGELGFLQNIWEEYWVYKIISIEELKQEVDQFLIKMINLLPFI